MECLRVALLGGFQAMPLSGPALIVPTKKAQALLAYCAFRPGQAHTRDKLAALLWGETAEEHARNSLRQSLFVLRTALGANLCRALRIEADTIAANPVAIDVDVVNFERFAAQGTSHALEAAAALYKGELLDGFVLDEEPFEEWLYRERERLRDLAVEVLAKLLRQQCDHGLAEFGIQTARRLLDLDPLLESVHRSLMRLFVQAGRREAALRQYEICVSLLKRELQVKPEPETRQLYEQIAQGRPHPSIPARVVRQEPVKTGSRVAGAESELRPSPHPVWAEYEVQLQKAKRECERARKLTQEIQDARTLLRRGLDETIREVTAFKKVFLDSATPRWDPPMEEDGSALSG
jgi:DNA-binding SARP family transcriptional activator